MHLRKWMRNAYSELFVIGLRHVILAAIILVRIVGMVLPFVAILDGSMSHLVPGAFEFSTPFMIYNMHTYSELFLIGLRHSIMATTGIFIVVSFYPGR